METIVKSFYIYYHISVLLYYLEVGKRNLLELLSPAGNMQSLKAAVQNGADAVYLGLKTFSARANADNFTFEELKEAVSYCHLRDVLVYVTINTLIDDSNMSFALDNAYKAYTYGVDAVIVQDLGLAAQIRKNIPSLRLHASTQMSVINPKEAILLKNMGFKRIIAAREATIEQIKALTETGIEIEVFGHGSLCVSYSGQCELSFFNGGKSGNKGGCAQPCRLPYTLAKEDKVLAFKNLLSTKDIAVMDHIKQIENANVVSLKIEGRMKSPEYVAIITRTYKKAISGTLTQKDRQDAMMVFNREGFSEGYMFSKPGKEMMAYNFSGNTGIKIGTVIGVNKEKGLIQIESDKELVNGDGISFPKNDLGMYVNIIRKNGNKYGLICRNGVPDNFEHVYLTYDKQLMEETQKSYSDDFYRKTVIKGVFQARHGEKAKFTVTDNRSNSFTAYSDIDVQEANSPDANQNILKNLYKTGNTVFEFEDISIKTDFDVFLPAKTVNALRRDALDGLTEIRKAISVAPVDKIFPKHLNINRSINRSDKKPGVSLFFFEDRPDFDIKDINADRIYMPESMYKRYSYDNRAYMYKPIGSMLNEKTILPKRVISSSMGILEYDCDKVMDFGINCLNTYTADFLAGYNNVKAVCLSHELPIEDISTFIGMNSNISFEYITYGRVAVMKTKYCIKGALNQMPECMNQDLHLLDRQKKRLDIVTYCDCHTSYLLGAFTINNINRIDEIRKSGADTLRINVYKETKEEIKEIINKLL